MSILVKSIVVGLWTIFTLLWAVGGLLLWIPILFRSAMFFAALVVEATVSGQSASAISRTAFEDACGFYFRGFRNFYKTCFLPPSAQPTRHSLNWGVFGREALFFCVFWLVAGSVIGFVLHLCGWAEWSQWLPKVTELKIVLGLVVAFIVGVVLATLYWLWEYSRDLEYAKTLPPFDVRLFNTTYGGLLYRQGQRLHFPDSPNKNP
ncbi:MAG TPA: hypothetical protein VD994_02210 [Prosthecobacter sp.]|nr:hypothetical protein [Prosthecobacter sp.]